VNATSVAPASDWVTLAELAELLGVSKTQANRIRNRLYMAGKPVAYRGQGPGRQYPLHAVLAALAEARDAS